MQNKKKIVNKQIPIQRDQSEQQEYLARKADNYFENQLAQVFQSIDSNYITKHNEFKYLELPQEQIKGYKNYKGQLRVLLDMSELTQYSINDILNHYNKNQMNKVVDFKRLQIEDDQSQLKYFRCPNVIIQTSKRIRNLSKKILNDIKRFSDDGEISDEYISNNKIKKNKGSSYDEAIKLVLKQNQIDSKQFQEICVLHIFDGTSLNDPEYLDFLKKWEDENIQSKASQIKEIANGNGHSARYFNPFGQSHWTTTSTQGGNKIKFHHYIIGASVQEGFSNLHYKQQCDEIKSKYEKEIEIEKMKVKYEEEILQLRKKQKELAEENNRLKTQEIQSKQTKINSINSKKSENCKKQNINQKENNQKEVTPDTKKQDSVQQEKQKPKTTQDEKEPKIRTQEDVFYEQIYFKNYYKFFEQHFAYKNKDENEKKTDIDPSIASQVYLPPKSIVCKYYERGTCKHNDKFYECYFLHGDKDYYDYQQLRQKIIDEFNDKKIEMDKKKQKEKDPNNMDYQYNQQMQQHIQYIKDQEKQQQNQYPKPPQPKSASSFKEYKVPFPPEKKNTGSDKGIGSNHQIKYQQYEDQLDHQQDYHHQDQYPQHQDYQEGEYYYNEEQDMYMNDQGQYDQNDYYNSQQELQYIEDQYEQQQYVDQQCDQYDQQNIDYNQQQYPEQYEQQYDDQYQYQQEEEIVYPPQQVQQYSHNNSMRMFRRQHPDYIKQQQQNNQYY